MNNESNQQKQKQINPSRTGYQRVIGVDVAKDKLDIHDSQGKLTGTIDNDVNSIAAKLLDSIEPGSSTLILCESTASYHLLMMDAVHHTAMVHRRESLLKMRTQEKLRLLHTSDKQAIKFLKEMLRNLANQLKSVEKRLAEILKELAKEDPTVEILLSHCGVGKVTASVLLTGLPEMATLNRKQIAKLVGVSPIANQSGTKDGRRPIRGGRQSVRNAMYMAAHSARQHDDRMKAFYDRLIKQGKPFKVVMTACMRKMLCTLNQMVRNQESYDASKFGCMV